MLQYILKRVVLMVPTFLFITIVVFAIINIAPGRPSQSMGASGSENADQSANAREGLRLFKEQYYLDRPILLNFRFMLDRDDVADELEIIGRNIGGSIAGETEALSVGATTAAVVGQVINARYAELTGLVTDSEQPEAAVEEARRELAGLSLVTVDAFRPPRPAQGDVFAAEERVENWGHVIVPQLIELASGYVALTSPDRSASSRAMAADLGLDPAATTAGVSVTFNGAGWIVDGALTAKVRFLAVQRLSVAARQPLVLRPGVTPTDAEREQNAIVVRGNARVTSMVYPITADAAEQAAVLAQWNEWYVEAQSRYERSTWGNVGMLFLETRFARYASNLARLDFGTSLRYNRPVMSVIGDHWKYSIFLSIASLILSYIIAVPIGVLAAVKQNQFADRGVGLFLFVLYSLPSFFAATLLQTWATSASDVLPLFPVSGFMGVNPLEVTTWQMLVDITWHMVLPTICLTYGSLAVLSRYARTGLLDVIRSDYIRTARAKGLSEFMVIAKHAVRNGMIPILTLLGTTLPVLIGGSIIIEYIFNIDGMGKLMLTAINYRDYNIIMGVLLISSVLTLVGILISDLSYALVDPRISFD
jgi:peptide/nickel transport system permease protein